MARHITLIFLIASAIAPLHACQSTIQTLNRFLLNRPKTELLTRALLAPLIVNSTLSLDQRTYYIEQALQSRVPTTLSQPCFINFDYNSSVISDSLITTSICWSQSEILKLLLNHGALPESNEPEKQLHRAIYCVLYAKEWNKLSLPEFKEMVKQLILHGSNPYLRDENGKNSIEFAREGWSEPEAGIYLEGDPELAQEIETLWISNQPYMN